MMRTKLVNEQQRQQRSDAKCLDTLFRRRMEQGANCAPFVSAAILDTVKEVYPLTPDDADCALGHGAIVLAGAAGLGSAA